MAGYFSNFPRIPYTLENDNTNTQYIVNILARSKFLKEISDEAASYYEYSLQDNETAEILADKLYGDPNRHWIILLFNRITNPLYDFPMSNYAFEEFIYSKYGQTVGEAQSTLHHYELEVERSTYVRKFKTDTNTDRYTIDEYEIDYDTGKRTLRSLPAVNGSLEVDYTIINMQDKVKVPLTGTLTTYSGGTTVYGSGTLFLSQVAVDDMIFIGGVKRYVTEVINNTELTIRFPAGSYSGVSGEVMQRSNEIREEITRINAISNYTYEFNLNEHVEKSNC